MTVSGQAPLLNHSRKQNCKSTTTRKKYLPCKDFLRRGGTSVFSVLFGFAEQPHNPLRSDECQRPTFAHTCAFAERCSGARYNCCHCAPQENRTQSRRRTLGFPFPHDFYQLPQPLAKKICFAKIFCEEEERAFSACYSALPNSRTLRSVPTSLCVRKFVNPL